MYTAHGPIHVMMSSNHWALYSTGLDPLPPSLISNNVMAACAHDSHSSLNDLSSERNVYGLLMSYGPGYARGIGTIVLRIGPSKTSYQLIVWVFSKKRRMRVFLFSIFYKGGLPALFNSNWPPILQFKVTTYISIVTNL